MTVSERNMPHVKEPVSRGNNGLVKRKYLTLTIEAEDLKVARARLSRIETDVLNLFKVIGAAAKPLNGKERLQVLHGLMHRTGSRSLLNGTGFLRPVSLSRIISPRPHSSLETQGCSAWGRNWVRSLSCKSWHRNSMTVCWQISWRHRTPHGDAAYSQYRPQRGHQDHQEEDHRSGRMKIAEQKKAVRAGYDMDIIPSDLATYGGEAKNLLRDLQSRNERMFLLTFLVVNLADTRQKLENNVFQSAGVAQKYNCALTRLDFCQEQGLMSSLPLGLNQVNIKRSLTTSSTAIFVPFTTQELFQGGRGVVLWAQRSFRQHDYGGPKAA